MNYRSSNVFVASELESTAGSNPVARWVEAVQPWMPGNKETEDSQETPDWTSRAKGEEQLPLSYLPPFDTVLISDLFSFGVSLSYVGLCEARPLQSSSR